MMTVLRVPDTSPKDGTITVDQQVTLRGGSREEHGRILLVFPATCPGHGGVPVEYKLGYRYPYDALLTGETIVICSDCGYVQIVQVDQRLG